MLTVNLSYVRMETRKEVSKLEKLLTVEEVAELLNVHTITVQRAIQKGDLIAAKIGRVYRISPEDLQAYIDSKKGAQDGE